MKVVAQEKNEVFYKSLRRIRRVEEEIARVYATDKIQSPVHLSIGQEAIAVGVCQALQPADVAFGSYRCHALYLAKGGDLPKMIAELYGKATGCAKGKGGSMHLIDVGAGVLGASAVVGTTIPQAVGYALALKLQGRPSIVASFFGDGAIEEGVFHECMNFAALKRAPIVFICENNGYAIHSRIEARQALKIGDLVRAYGIPVETIDDMDVFGIHERVREAADLIRADKSGPRFIECHCCRWLEHVGPHEDFQAGYRARAEAEAWFAGDQVKRLAGLLPADVCNKIDADVEEEIREAFAFAERSPVPNDQELYADLYKEA